MRGLIVLTLAVLACSGDRQASSGGAATGADRGPDQAVLRVPRAGGTARVYLYPRLDSSVWAVAAAPRIGRVLAFDAEAGLIALVDAAGLPRRVDLRLGEIRFASRAPLTSLASVNGTEIYGVTASGSVLRMTPSGDWTFTPPSAARWVLPQRNGLVVVVGNARMASTRLWALRAPDEEILDSASLPLLSRPLHTQLGDRIYFPADSGLAGVAAKGLSRLKTIPIPGSIIAVAPTPSGDRLYVVTRGADRISIVNRYSESVTGSILLPGAVSELRMDPLGQYILARPAIGGDSAWVVAIGNNRPVGLIKTRWLADLPTFAPAATIATARGDDVIFVSASTLQDVKTVTGGTRDFWYFFAWNGFRPRSANLDQPVTFGIVDSVARTDSTSGVIADSMAPPPIRDTAPSMVVPQPSYPQPARRGFLLSFAAVLTEQRAREIAAGIEVGGVRPHVVPSETGTAVLYRVVLGPFASREEADRVGATSKRQYWIFESAQ